MSFWIDTESPLKLAIAARPQGGVWLKEDIHQLKNDGIDLRGAELDVQFEDSARQAVSTITEAQEKRRRP